MPFSLNAPHPKASTWNSTNACIPMTHRSEADITLRAYEEESPPEKEELGISVNQKPYDQTHLSELCEKREGCK